MFKLPAAFYRQTDQITFEPSEATIGPWSPDFQHGGPPSALMTHALRTYPSPLPMKITRITIEILSAVPVKPCEITVEVIRCGKRVELLRGEYRAEGKTYLIAHAWRFFPEPGLTGILSDSYEIPPFPGPQTYKSFQGVSYFPYGEALEWRFTQGAYDTFGPATVWTRPKIPLIENLTTDPLEALMLMVDSANGISAELDSRSWTFVPVDLTLGLHRHPEGEWVGMDARTVMENDGIGQTTTIVFDSRGKVGLSVHSLFIRPN
ncbi:MAG: thioesterase family protein [Deltaproteobacteria bacterium]|nr:thioesterase family protein [Deltaproteobacteria bacterium]